MPEGASQGIESCIGLYIDRGSRVMLFSLLDNFRWNPIACAYCSDYHCKQRGRRQALGFSFMFTAKTHFMKWSGET
jgi:hypothetical protein